MSVTIKQIAERIGLSVPTVGNILGASASRYSEKTRLRVLEAVREMGYRPNASARAMRAGKIGCAALILSRTRLQSHSYIPDGLLNGLDLELSRYNMHLTVSLMTDEQLSTPAVVPKILREYAADGMIINYTHAIPSRMLGLIHAHHIPAVWLNAKLQADCVYADDFAGAADATQVLIDRGHRRILLAHFIDPESFAGQAFEAVAATQHYSVADRIEGFRTTMHNAGLAPLMSEEFQFVSKSDVFEKCRHWLSQADRPTAVIAYSLHETVAVLTAATSLGLSIPRDLTVLQFWPTNECIAGTVVPGISIPTEASGRQAVKMLLRKIASPDVECEPDIVRYPKLSPQFISPPAST